MMKEKSKGGFPTPKEHKEVTASLNSCCGEKYASGNNPADLEKSAKGLSDYVKKNKMKY